MLSCEIKIVKHLDNDKMQEVEKELAKKLTKKYQDGGKTPKVGDKVGLSIVKKKTSDDHFIYLII